MGALGADPGSVEGHRWLAALPLELGRQRDLVARLLQLSAVTPGVSSLAVGCSLGRGAADALSDVDAVLGVDAPRGAPGADRIRAVEDAVVAAVCGRDVVVDVLRDQVGPPDRCIRRVLCQYRDGLQLDLAITAETEVRRGRAAPDFVPLYRRSTPPVALDDPASPALARFAAADAVTGEQVYEWAFLGWFALADVDKHLRRRSLWEAHDRLHDARGRVWALWAAANGALYPWHGLSQVLDHDPRVLPPGIDATVARLEQADLQRAAYATAGVLAQVSRIAAATHRARLPADLADVVTSRLATGDRG